MTQPKPAVLFDEKTIARRVSEVGQEVTRAYEGREVCVVGLMKSGLCFMADMIRQLPLDMTCHMLRSASLRGVETGGSPRTDIVFSAEIPYDGRDILLLDGVLDTGITLNFLLDHIRERHARSLRVCTLIDKPTERKIDVRPDWALFTLKEPLPDGRFIVGYGLDYLEHYRGLSYLGTIPRPEPPPGARPAGPGR
jgi:hypoxanthine phosphoribosyltransferase